MKIWGRLSSINVRKVVWAAQETVAVFTRVDADDDFSMANIPLGCEMHRWFGLPLAHDTTALPDLQRWSGALRDRAASRGVLDLPLS